MMTAKKTGKRVGIMANTAKPDALKLTSRVISWLNRKGIECLALTSDGRLLASGGYDKTIKVWDTTTLREPVTLEGHSGVIWSIAFSPGGTMLVSASEDCTVRLWDTATGQQRTALDRHTDSVDAVAWSADGKMVASASGETIRLWDVAALMPE